MKRHDHGKVSLADIAFNPNLGGFVRGLLCIGGAGERLKLPSA